MKQTADQRNDAVAAAEEMIALREMAKRVLGPRYDEVMEPYRKELAARRKELPAVLCAADMCEAANAVGKDTTFIVCALVEALNG